mgnify:FL=1
MHRKPSRGLAGHGRNRDGTPDERMLAYYYNGIVYSFSGDSEQEMQNYLKAERFAEKAENKRAAGRLYKAKMAVYNKVYDYKAAIEEGKTAARYYLESSDTARYLSAINDIVAVSDLAEDSLTRMENLKILEERRDAKIRSDNYILYIIIISLTLVIICLVSVLLYQKVQKVKWEKAQEAINHRNKQNALIQEKEAVEKRLMKN